MKTMLFRMLFLFLMVGCSQDPSFISKDLGIGTSNANPVNPDLLDISWKLNIESFDSESTEPLDIMLIIDNSYSMKDNVEKLDKSLPALYKSLVSKGIDLTTRVITLDMLLDQLVSHSPSNSKAPFKLFAGDWPSFDRGNIDDPYKSVQVASNLDAFNAVSSNLEGILTNPEFIDNEPGICLAMDYLNWSTFNNSLNRVPAYPANQKLHIIMLSDEDNARSIKEFDVFGTETSDTSLSCYQESSPELCSVKNYNKYLSWEEHCYSYKLPSTKTEYVYNGNYDKKGFCQSNGFASDQESMPLVNLYASTICGLADYTCTDRNAPNFYQCAAGSYETGSNVDLSLAEASSVRCAVSAQLECLVKVDGQDVWVPKSKTQASSLNSLGVECRNSGDLFQQTLLSTQAFNPDHSLKLGVESCSPFSCTATSWASVRVPVNQINQDRHESCQLRSVQSKTASAFSLQSSQGKLNSVSFEVCPADYNLFAQNNKLSSANFCLGNVQELELPEEVTYREVGTSQSQSAISFQIKSSTPLTMAQLAAKLGTVVSMVRLNTDSPSLSQIDTTVVKTSECSSYERLAPAASSDFKEVSSTSFAKVMDSQAHLPALTRGGDIQTSQVYEVGGRYEEKTCDASTYSQKITSATPKDFRNHMRSKFPKMSLTWHSIINLDGKSCQGLNETNVSEGSDYKELSRATGGVIDNICVDNFDQSLSKIATSVLTEIKVIYTLPEKLIGKDSLLIRNTRTGRYLQENEDFWTEGDSLILSKTAVSKDDLLEVFLPVFES